MVFEPSKSELIHFTRARTAPSQVVRLGAATVAPSEATRFLGIWIDRKLRWKAHLQKIRATYETQSFALSKLAASAWDCTLARAREVYYYTKVVRSAIAYGASAYHTPSEKGGKARGIAARLAPLQARSLRQVAGAYRATPIRMLEAETDVPPMDLYLNQELAAFEARPKETGMAAVIRNAYAKIRERLRRRGAAGRPRRLTRIQGDGEETKQWARRWLDKGTPEQAVKQDWALRYRAQRLRARRRRPFAAAEPAEAPPRLIFGPEAIQRHKGQRKSESSTLIQIRTGRIGLRAFLMTRIVPTVATPLCQCGKGEETPEHIILHCLIMQPARQLLEASIHRPMRTLRDLF